MNICKDIFCGCQYYTGLGGDITTKVYISIGVMLAVITGALRLGSQWFIFKDYYPMKERSPVLCILMIGIITVQLILYPLIYTYNYFTRNWGDLKYYYRGMFYAFDGGLYFIFLIRSLRLVYAHQIDTSRSRSLIFKFFKHEYNLVLFVMIMMVLKVIPITTASLDLQKDLFLTFIDVNSYTYSDEYSRRQLQFGVKQSIHQFIWLGIILYCLWLQTLVHPKYSMKKQLICVFILGLIFNITQMVIFWTQLGEHSVISSICQKQPSYPILQLIRDINVLGIGVISVMLPLLQKRIYHMLLPTGRHHDIVKTMRDFLFEDQFNQIFSAYLAEIDRVKETTRNSQLLQHWKTLIWLKFKSQESNLRGFKQPQGLPKAKELIQAIEERPLKQIHQKLLGELKQSILSLQSWQQDQDGAQEGYRLLDDINAKIEQLQQIYLQRLDHIYKTDFRQTKSYYYLKMYFLSNKKININMITLGMAVMIESDQL